MKMENSWVRNIAILIFAMSFAAIAVIAQEEQANKAAGTSITVTGCLQKGDETGEYAITGEDGKTYGLRGKNVDFSKHLGHKVEVTGTKMRHENEAKENGAKEEDMHLNVSSLKHISETCK